MKCRISVEKCWSQTALSAPNESADIHSKRASNMLRRVWIYCKPKAKFFQYFWTKKLDRGQDQIILRMRLWLLWQCVRDSIWTSQTLETEKLKMNALTIKGTQLYSRGMTGREWRAGQSVTDTTFVLMNHKLDALMTASAAMHSESASWSMSYWMKTPARWT